jgi:Spy/CpxP family protein refolding chaperone
MKFRVALFAILLAALPMSGAAQKSPGNTAPGQGQYGVRPNPGTESHGFWRVAPGMRMEHSLKVLQRDLNLTDSQLSQIKQLVESRKTKFESIHEQAMPKFEHLMSLMRQSNPDPTAVGKAALELKQVHEQAAAEQAKLERDFYGVLNDSQRATVDKLKNQAPDVLALHRLGLITPEWTGTEQAFLSGQ